MPGAILIISIVLIVGVALLILVFLSSSVQEHSSHSDDEEISITYFDNSGPSSTREEPPKPSRKQKSSNHFSIKSIFQPIQHIMKSLSSKLKETLRTIQESLQKAKEKRLESSQKSQNQVRVTRDKEIQRAVQKREAQNSQLEPQKNEIDTSFLEKPVSTKNPIRSIVQPEQISVSNTKGFSALIDTEEEILPITQDLTVSSDTEDLAKKQDKQKDDIPEKSLEKNVPSEEKADSFVNNLLSDQNESEYMQSVKEPETDTISDGYYYTYMEKRYIDKIMKNPRDISAYKKLGDLYVEMNNLGDAKESYAMVLKLKPQDDATRRKMRAVEDKLSRK